VLEIISSNKDKTPADNKISLFLLERKEENIKLMPEVKIIKICKFKEELMKH
jgi:hypothetical protein